MSELISQIIILKYNTMISNYNIFQIKTDIGLENWEDSNKTLLRNLIIKMDSVHL